MSAGTSKNKSAALRKISLVASMTACPSTVRLSSAVIAGGGKPCASSVLRQVSVAKPPLETCDTRSARCWMVECSHSVLVMDAPNAPAVERRKFCRPAAFATLFCGMPANDIVMIGRNIIGVPSPWMNCGNITIRMVTSVVNVERIRNATISTTVPMLTIMRGSYFPDSLPTTIAESSAPIPCGAVAKPDCSDV